MLKLVVRLMALEMLVADVADSAGCWGIWGDVVPAIIIFHTVINEVVNGRVVVERVKG